MSAAAFSNLNGKASLVVTKSAARLARSSRDSQENRRVGGREIVNAAQTCVTVRNPDTMVHSAPPKTTSVTGRRQKRAAVVMLIAVLCAALATEAFAQEAASARLKVPELRGSTLKST